MVLGLLHASRIISTVLTYRMTKLTDLQISPVELYLNSIFYMIVLVLPYRNLTRKRCLPIGISVATNNSPRSSLFLAPFTEPVVACPGEAKSLPTSILPTGNMRPSTFSTHPVLLPVPSSGFFIMSFYSMGLPHAVLAALCLWNPDQATARSTSYRKPLVWTYRTRTMTQKIQASVQAAISIA